MYQLIRESQLLIVKLWGENPNNALFSLSSPLLDEKILEV